MKKWFTLILACILCLSICGCGAQAAEMETEPTTEATEPTEKFEWNLGANTSSGCAMEGGTDE